MNEEAKYKGTTAQGYLDILQEEISLPAAQAERLEDVDRQAERDRQGLAAKLKTEFEKMALARGKDPEALLESARKACLRERVKGVAIRHPNYYQTDEGYSDTPLTISQFQEFQLLDSVDERVRFLEQYVDAGAGGGYCEGYEDLEIALDRIKRIISDGVETEDAIRYALQAFGSTMPPDARKEIWRLERELEELGRFRRELSALIVPLRARSVLFKDSGGLSLQTTKIDWLGTKTDCKILVDFLKGNGYIDAPYVNKFIAAHFTFKGESVNVETVGGWKPGRDGTFLVFGKDGLKIPVRS